MTGTPRFLSTIFVLLPCLPVAAEETDHLCPDRWIMKEEAGNK
jgi:hypothetical protein